MIDAITFDKDGHMLVILESMSGERAEIGLGDDMCAVFRHDPDYNFDNLPDAELIRKCLAKPCVHVFSGIEKCQKGFAENGTNFSRKVFWRRVTSFLREKAQSLLSELI